MPGRTHGRIIWWAALGAVLAVLLFLSGDRRPPEAREENGLAILKEVGGWVVFDSNREGQFDIFRMRPDGSEVTRLTRHPDWDMYPGWSPDGRKIVFARHAPDEGLGRGDVYRMNADGSGEKLVAENGTFPQFTPDGRSVIFERERKMVMIRDLDGGRVRRLLPRENKDFGHQMVKPRISPDGSRVAFTSDKGGRWTLWTMDLDGRAAEVGPGCEGVWEPGGKRVFYISGTRLVENAVWVADPDDPRPQKHLSLQGRYRHIYFPNPSRDGAYLLFAASPAGQHDHFSANYQIFIKPEGKKPVRISWNDHTDRWPSLSPVP